jgi:hypothetical protein
MSDETKFEKVVVTSVEPSPANEDVPRCRRMARRVKRWLVKT